MRLQQLIEKRLVHNITGDFLCVDLIRTVCDLLLDLRHFIVTDIVKLLELIHRRLNVSGHGGQQYPIFSGTRAGRICRCRTFVPEF